MVCALDVNKNHLYLDALTLKNSWSKPQVPGITGKIQTMKTRSIFLILTISLLLTSCGKKSEATLTPELPTPQSQILSVTEEALPEPTSTATPEPVQEKYSQYHFDLLFDYAQHTLQVEQEIVFLNKYDFPMNEILLVIPPRFFPGVYTQTSLQGDLIASSSEDGIKTALTLSQPLSANESLTINLSYTLNLPNREGTLGFTDRQTNLSNWYPYIPPRDQNGNWLAHEPFIDASNMVVGEYIVNEIADFTVNFQLVGNTPDLLIATGACPIPMENGTRYELPKARAIAFSISNQYHLEEIQHNDLLIQAYVFSNQKQNASAITRIAAQAMDLFSELYGEYPRERVVIVSADFLHNMEMDGMVLLSNKIIDFYDGTPLNNLTILIPHELSHQWFYSLVGNDQAFEPWLDEAIATYSESLFYERYHPEYLQWWWNNRVYAHEHNGYVNNSIYEAGSYENYRASVYLNGAIFMQDLSENIGKEAFLSALRHYVKNNQYGVATQKEFFDALYQANPIDLNHLLLKYFRQ